MQKALHVKEEKLRGMRLAIVRLKEEFIKAEEQRAAMLDRSDVDKENRHREHEEQMVDQVKLKCPHLSGIEIACCLI